MPSTSNSQLMDAPQIAQKIDSILATHWAESEVQPTAPASDSEFLRRVSVDLLGRIPTAEEARIFFQDSGPDKRSRLITRLMNSPEYALHLGRVLDEIIQDKYAGDGEFVEFLRESVANRTGWDAIFRQIINGPWETKEAKRSSKFLVQRMKSLDDLTNDTSRVFFGVNVSCAKCHDHPLVPDWTQEHYYGLASFFNRTHEASKNKPNEGIKEANKGDVKYVTVKGVSKVARPMFLSNKVVSSEPPKGKDLVSLRQELVSVALEDRVFFRRAIVNRLWANFFGRGLIDPLDQMHAANLPTVPKLLEWLGDDFASHGYQLDRLIAGMLMSRAYQSTSIGDSETLSEQEAAFARATLRPLTPQQYVASMLLATGHAKIDASKPANARANDARQLDSRANGMARMRMLDAPAERFQSSAVEALFLSNHADVQKLMQPGRSPLIDQLAKMDDAKQILELAFLTILTRTPDAEEIKELSPLLVGPAAERPKRVSLLVWALVTSAEFRFNH
ncbi:DUF1549 domain-containing protein [Tuwongella immobilis]|nr:DUF1549 domain-containing protein [Tuwongella immobilis]